MSPLEGVRRLLVMLIVAASVGVTTAQDDPYAFDRQAINEIMNATYAQAVTCSRALLSERASEIVLYCGTYPYSKNVFEMELEQYASGYGTLTYSRAIDRDYLFGPIPGELTVTMVAGRTHRTYFTYFVDGFVIVTISQDR